jgi:hypothetical protein
MFNPIFYRSTYDHEPTGAMRTQEEARRGCKGVVTICATNRVYAISPPFAVLKFAGLIRKKMLVRGISRPAPPTVV